MPTDPPSPNESWICDARYCSVTNASVMPCLCGRSKMCPRHGLLTVDTIGLGRLIVSGRRRLPSPPAITTACICREHRRARARADGQLLRGELAAAEREALGRRDRWGRRERLARTPVQVLDHDGLSVHTQRAQRDAITDEDGVRARRAAREVEQQGDVGERATPTRLMDERDSGVRTSVAIDVSVG